jgi:hypothetical protein
LMKDDLYFILVQHCDTEIIKNAWVSSFIGNTVYIHRKLQTNSANKMV